MCDPRQAMMCVDCDNTLFEGGHRRDARFQICFSIVIFPSIFQYLRDEKFVSPKYLRIAAGARQVIAPSVGMFLHSKHGIRFRRASQRKHDADRILKRDAKTRLALDGRGTAQARNLIIVSGDKGFRPTYDTARNHDIHVQFLAWNKHISPNFRRHLAGDNGYVALEDLVGYTRNEAVRLALTMIPKL